MELFKIGDKFKSPYDVVCEVIAVIPELDSDGIQCYVIKTFYEIGKFMFDIAEHDVLANDCIKF